MFRGTNRYAFSFFSLTYYPYSLKFSWKAKKHVQLIHLEYPKLTISLALIVTPTPLAMSFFTDFLNFLRARGDF